MPTGTIVNFDQARGFGFIRPDRCGPDVYVRTETLQRASVFAPVAGTRLGYDVRELRGRLRATAVRRLVQSS